MKIILLKILIFFTLIEFFSSCIISYETSYLGNDSISVFSTHPSRPFKYGYPYSKEDCNVRYKDYLLDFDFQKRDVIADVGAASGWLEGVFSVLSDSMTFYIQDIDTNFLNKTEFEKVISYYSSVRASPQTNKFIFIIGDQLNTKLPNQYFDKIILNNTFHEIAEQKSIIEDLYTKIKPQGKIIIKEKFSNSFVKKKHPGCNIKAVNMESVEELFNSVGLYLTKMSSPKNALDNFLTFEKDNLKSLEYKNQKIKVEKYIKELDKLYKKDISNNVELTKNIALQLKSNLKEIESVYRTLEWYIIGLGDHYYTTFRYESAINVYNVNLILYPQSMSSYFQLGQIYRDLQSYDLALSYFDQCLTIKPNFNRALNEINYIKKIKQKKTVR